MSKYHSKLRLVTNNLGSSSLKLLAQELSTKVGYKVFRSKVTKPNRVCLKYGDCKDKLFQYEWYAANEVPALSFTTDQGKALAWLSEGNIVFARTLTRSSEGKGIVVLNTPGNVVPAPVYTLYRKKKKEFRVHVYKDKVVAVLEKRKKKEFCGERDTKIRNTANGYVFCSDGVIEPPGIRELALKARKVTTSDFAGVDIGYNEKLNELFVIETNSAPGMSGSTPSKYVEVMLNEK